jgi:3-phenylpropionate/trans-cinnamate dioxygenase ferredoxin reductase component
VPSGDLDGGQFVAFWADDRQVVTAAMKVNVWDVLEDLKTRIQTSRPADPVHLADLDRSLTDPSEQPV